jgi:hypothetical protein
MLPSLLFFRPICFVHLTEFQWKKKEGERGCEREAPARTQSSTIFSSISESPLPQNILQLELLQTIPQLNILPDLLTPTVLPTICLEPSTTQTIYLEPSYPTVLPRIILPRTILPRTVLPQIKWVIRYLTKIGSTGTTGINHGSKLLRSSAS